MPLVGETMAYWPVKSRVPPGAPIMRSTMTSTRRPGASKAGQGLGADTGGEAGLEGGGEVAGEARRGVSAQSDRLERSMVSAGQRGDLERFDVGRDGDVGDDDAADGEACLAATKGGGR